MRGDPLRVKGLIDRASGTLAPVIYNLNLLLLNSFESLFFIFA